MKSIKELIIAHDKKFRDGLYTMDTIMNCDESQAFTDDEIICHFLIHALEEEEKARLLPENA